MIILRYTFLIFLGFMPSLFWLWVVRFLDRKNPEPLKVIVKVFLWGILITLPAFILAKTAMFFLEEIPLSFFWLVVLSSFLIDGLIEESAKYAVVRNKAFSSPHFNEPLDGIVYGVTVALGMAFFENAFMIMEIGPEIIGLRFATATLMHFLAGGILGYFMGMAKFDPARQKVLIGQGLILAILFHGFYNTIAKAGFAYSLIPLTILLIIIYFVILRGVRKMRRIRV